MKKIGFALSALLIVVIIIGTAERWSNRKESYSHRTEQRIAQLERRIGHLEEEIEHVTSKSNEGRTFGFGTALKDSVLNSSQLRCPVCQERGYTSTVYIGMTTETAMAIHSYYTEEGWLITNNPNIATTHYQCSRGHEFIGSSKPGHTPTSFTVTDSTDKEKDELIYNVTLGRMRPKTW